MTASRGVVFCRLLAAGRQIERRSPGNDQRTDVITCDIQYVMRRMQWSRAVAAKWLYANAAYDADTRRWTLTR